MAKTFKVRATARGFGGVPAARRAVGEVFRVPANDKGELPKSSWYQRAEQAAEGKPEVKTAQLPDYQKVGGNYVPVDQRTSAGAFQPPPPPLDTSYLDKFKQAETPSPAADGGQAPGGDSLTS